jgi:hypothetical protein
MQLKPIAVIAVLLVVVASLSVSGCTTSTKQNSTTGGQTSQVMKYAEAVNETFNKNSTGKNVTVTTKIVANGTDAVRMTVTLVNKTKDPKSLSANGSTTTEAFNIKQFANKGDAKKFYDDISFGYAANSEFQKNVSKQGDNPYFVAMGREPTSTQASWKIDSFSFVSLSASVAIQQDEFVTYGTMSVMPGSSS